MNHPAPAGRGRISRLLSTFFPVIGLTLLLALTISLLTTPLFSQEGGRPASVVTGEGTFRGMVMTQTGDSLYLQTKGGILVAIPQSSIEQIHYQTSADGEISEMTPSRENPSDEGKRSWSSKPWFVGLAIGSPGTINLVLGREIVEGWSLRLSGYSGVEQSSMLNGTQLDVTHLLAQTGPVNHSMFLGLGTDVTGSHFPSFRTNVEPYAVIGYDAEFYGLRASVEYGESYQLTYHNFADRFLAQVGYDFHFSL